MPIPEKRWTLHDTLNVKRITSLDVSPDGRRLAFTVMRAVMTSTQNSFQSQVYLADAPGSRPIRLAAGECPSSAPQWSPDGRFVAFLAQGNVWLHSLETGEVQQATAVPTGVSSFKWSPDGGMIAFTAAYGRTPAQTQEKNGVRIVGQGLQKQRLHLLALAELAHGPVSGRPLTGDDIHVGAPEVPEAYNWSPDGQAIVFAHSPSPQPNDWPGTRLALLTLADGAIRPLGEQDTVAFDAHFSPDGRCLAYKVYDTPAWEWSSVIHVLPLDGGHPRPLADTHDRRPDLLGWSANGTLLYFLETCGVRQRLCALPVNGRPPVVLFEPEGVIENPSLNKTRTALGFTLQTPSRPPEAYLAPLEAFSPVQMSQVNAEFSQRPIGRTEVIRWQSVDGLAIEGLLTYPVGYEKGRRYPLLVSVHGGPANVWRQFFIGLQSFYGPIAAFASQGYAILRCNVRGSTGYGQAFRRGNYRDWGGMDVRDLLAGVDHVIGLGVADPKRLGITGWSYGGYLTAATLTQTGRFRAAVIGAGMVNLVSYALGHDSPDFLPAHFGGEVWEVADLLLDRSPITHVDRVTTPTLHPARRT
jgi:dipeptidyl aminopeptidase/acylaminoacyl peptidase